MGAISTDNGRFKFNSRSKINNIGCYKSVARKWSHLKSKCDICELIAAVYFNAAFGHNICIASFVTIYWELMYHF